MSSINYGQFDRRRACAYVLALVGLIASAYGLHIQPESYATVFATAKWIFVSTFSLVAFFVGLLGIWSNRLTSHHLKVIDLVWVSASAVAVSLAAVHASQTPTTEYRKTIEKNIEKSRRTARVAIASAYRDECVSQSVLTDAQCEQLRRLGIAVEEDGYLSPDVVAAICPRPIRLDAPPVNFNSALIEGCINAGYVAYAPEDPVMTDESNVKLWDLYSGFWPQLMIFLVALRVAKSAAEVFWKIK